MEPTETPNILSFVVLTLASTYLISLAYKNVKFLLKHKIAQKREEAVTREVMKKVSDKRVLWKKNEVADYEATTFSIFYNNAVFLVLVIVLSFYVLRSFSPLANYVLSIGSASSLLALFSTGSK